MAMKITKMNNGFFKLGADEYRVEAPMKMPSEYRLEDFTDATGRAQQRYVEVKRGKKLRGRVAVRSPDGVWGPNPDEPEPKIWHLYKMIKFVRDGVDKQTLEILDDNFTGTAKEAIAVCEAHKAGG